MRIGKLSLGLKFSIAVTLLIIFTMFGVATLIINYQKETLRQSTYESNRAMTKNLAHDAAESLLLFNPLRLNELVDTMLKATSYTYAMIIDRDGNIVAHTNRTLLGSHISRLNRSEHFQPLSEGRELVMEYAHETGPVKELTFPIKIGSEVLGLAIVAYSLSTMDAAIEARLVNLKRYIYLITGLMILVGIGMTFIVSNFLTKPLKRLKDRMLDVQAGNLDVEVENPRIQKCWELLGCERADCPAYGKLRCWTIAGTCCHGEMHGAFAKKIGDCRKCVVYQESCGDEIQELVEVFNQMLKELRYNLNELEKANAERARFERLSALGEMGTTVAHEIRNPLNSIRIAADYLKKNFQGEILSEFLTIIEEEAMRLNDITSGFLGFSKPEPLKWRPCDINTIVRPTVELIRQEAMDRNIEVVILTDEHIPPVSCDYSRIKQALMNLLVNALDASREGDTITVATENKNSTVTISVRDTGKGVVSEALEKIFKPFYTTKTKGSGLGLAIVERIVKEHRGEVTVESQQGKGSRFTIKIPVENHGYTENPRR
jgi:signal transduction histidine kinase